MKCGTKPTCILPLFYYSNKFTISVAAHFYKNFKKVQNCGASSRN